MPTVAPVHASFFYEATLIEIGVYLFYLLDVFRHKRHSSELLPNHWSQVKIKWFPGSYGYTHQYTKECKHLHITVSSRARGIQKKPVEHVKNTVVNLISGMTGTPWKSKRKMTIQGQNARKIDEMNKSKIISLENNCCRRNQRKAARCRVEIVNSKHKLKETLVTWYKFTFAVNVWICLLGPVSERPNSANPGFKIWFHFLYIPSYVLLRVTFCIINSFFRSQGTTVFCKLELHVLRQENLA